MLPVWACIPAIGWPVSDFIDRALAQNVGVTATIGVRAIVPVLDPLACDRARIARDQRFDGQFFTGVKTTGIYCRPVCPVKPARSANVRFFPSAAAAECAGFRPCLRCCPEAAPGTLAWDGSAAILSRALQLVDRGYLDEHTVAELAGELTVGPRQLNRIFARHLGASPLRVAHTHRVQTAKRLLTETRLPITQIAFASGFSSVRRFNAAFLATYGRPPSLIRRSRAGESARAQAGIALCLAYRPPLNWPLLRQFLSAEATPGVEDVSATGYRRTIKIAGEGGWLEAQPVPDQDAVRLFVVLPTCADLRAMTQRVRQIFDLDADPSRIGRQLGRDPRIKGLVPAAHGIRLPGTWDGFELAVRAILLETEGDPAN